MRLDFTALLDQLEACGYAVMRSVDPDEMKECRRIFRRAIHQKGWRSRFRYDADSRALSAVLFS